MATRRTNGESNWPIKIICSPPKAARNAAPTIYARDAKQYIGVAQWPAYLGAKDYGTVARMDRIAAADFADAGDGLWTWCRVGDCDFDAGDAHRPPAHHLVDRASCRRP